MRDIVERMVTDLPPDNTPSAEPETSLSSSDRGLDSFRRPRVNQSSIGSIQSEIQDYYQDVASEAELLEYWTLYGKKYPRLARLVQRLISIPANSTQFPASFSDGDWASWTCDPAAVSVAFLRSHKTLLPPLRPPNGMGR